MTSWGSPFDGSSASAVPGMKLGDRYELKEPLASGGMAQVWSAVDTVLDRTVAAKILHPHLATDQAFVERFRREAVAAARLSHSSIVGIYDTISTGRLEVIVMELIDGRTLRHVLDEVGAMPAAEVIRIGAEIAAALDEAHRAGIVHRDIKPANIMIANDGRVLVTDFGIAKAGTDADLTVTGTLLGTAKYLAPEQVTGDAIDPRADLYSLGVVLFEALTGTVPFRANTDAATALARLHQTPPPVRQLRPNVSPELEAVVAKLMARDPHDRYPRASAAREALLHTGSSPVSRPPSSEPPTSPAPDRSAVSAFAPTPASTAGAAARAAAVTGRPTPVPATLVPWTPATPAPPGEGGHANRDLAPVASRPPDPPHLPVRIQAPSPGPVDGLDLGRPPDGGRALSAERLVRSRRSRLLPVLGVAVIIAAVAGATSLLTDIGVDDMLDSVIGAESPAPLTVVDVSSFDPQTSDANKEEQQELAPLAIDGDPNTAWATERYRQRELGGLKDGVGLLLELSEARPLSEIELQTNTADWTAEIYVADSFSDDGSDWGDPVASIVAGSNRVVRPLDQAQGAIVLLWIRDTGVTGDRFQFELAEVTVR